MSKLPIFGVILVLLVFVGGGIFFLNQQPESQPTPEIPEDWLTYTTTAMSYQINYPPYWDAVVETDMPSLNVVRFSDDTGQNKNYAVLLSGRATGRDTFGFSCMEEIEEKSLMVGNIPAVQQIFTTRGGVYRPPDWNEDLPCRDPLGAYAVLVDFAINGTGDPVADYANSEYKEYSFEFYIFDGDVHVVDDILSTFSFVK